MNRTGCLYRGLVVLEDRQDWCIPAFINRQQANAAQNFWEALPYCIMKHHSCTNVWYHRVQQEISGVQHQRCGRRKQSQSYSSSPLQKHPNPLVLTPQDDNPSDHTLMHNRAQTSVLWVNYGRAAQEHLRPGHSHIGTNFLPQVTRVWQTNPSSSKDWIK